MAEPCATCRGSGEVYLLTQGEDGHIKGLPCMPCPNCKGSGDETEVIVEREADGTPYPSHEQPTGPCATCKGSGQVPFSCSEKGGPVHAPCPDCTEPSEETQQNG